MTKNRIIKKILSIISIFFISSNFLYSEIMILSECKNLKDSFIKNEYILDLEKSLMTRNYIYDNKTYKKHRITDLSIKKKILLNDLFMKTKILFSQIRLAIHYFTHN